MEVTESAKLLADGFQITTAPISVQGPPFEVEFGLLPGENWPEVGLLLMVSGMPLIKITTSEPRLHAVFAQLENSTR